MRGVSVGLRQPHRQIDGGVVGDIEEQDLRGADQQDVFDLRRRRRQTLFEQDREQMAQCAEAAQHCRDDGSHQGAVALRQRAEIALLKLLVERPLLPEHATDNVGGDAARGEAGRRRR